MPSDELLVPEFLIDGSQFIAINLYFREKEAVRNKKLASTQGETLKFTADCCLSSVFLQ